MKKPPIVEHRPIPDRQDRIKLVKPDFTRPMASKPNPLQEAAHWLGDRLVEREAGYFLDGVPVGLHVIMKETNRVLKAAGKAQIATDPRWIVP